MSDGAAAAEPERDVLGAAERALRDWRYEQAQRCGLGDVAAAVFAGGRADVGVLRKLAAAGVAPDLIARIVL